MDAGFRACESPLLDADDDVKRRIRLADQVQSFSAVSGCHTNVASRRLTLKLVIFDNQESETGDLHDELSYSVSAGAIG
ncbi:MAG: hypothetical protein ACXWIE_21745 [Burkholderiales bacterium]